VNVKIKKWFVIIKYIKSEDFIMNPLVAAACIAAGLSVGLAAIGLEWDKELLLVTCRR
jgi:hypothetical protein